MKVADVSAVLGELAPLDLAEDGDNVGLLLGDRSGRVAKVMLCIDLTEPVLAEAIAQRAQMVVAYHPVIYRPVGRVTAQDSPVVHRAIRARLAVYCPHTALDAAPGGADDVLADVLGLVDRRALRPIRRGGDCKLVVFTPPEALHRVSRAAFDAGAGRIGHYYDCAFFTHGVGTFCGGPGTHPTVGRAGRFEAVEELRLEVLAPRERLVEVLSAIRAAHPYEQPAIDAYPLTDLPEGCGSGRVGRLPAPQTVAALVRRIKRAVGVSRVLLVSPHGASRRAGSGGASKRSGDGQGMLVSTAAVGAGAWGSRYESALSAGATFLLTGEMRHHHALDAAARGLTVVCVGHSNSERLALVSLARRLRKRLPRLAITRSGQDADPFEIV